MQQSILRLLSSAKSLLRNQLRNLVEQLFLWFPGPDRVKLDAYAQSRHLTKRLSPRLQSQHWPYANLMCVHLIRHVDFRELTWLSSHSRRQQESHVALLRTANLIATVPTSSRRYLSLTQAPLLTALLWR